MNWFDFPLLTRNRMRHRIWLSTGEFGNCKAVDLCSTSFLHTQKWHTHLPTMALLNHFNVKVKYVNYCWPVLFLPARKYWIDLNSQCDRSVVPNIFSLYCSFSECQNVISKIGWLKKCNPKKTRCCAMKHWIICDSRVYRALQKSYRPTLLCDKCLKN